MLLSGEDLYYESEGFPSLRLRAEYDPFNQEREFWHYGTATMRGAGYGRNFANEEVRLRGRGNSTWWFGRDKRPLRLRFSPPRYMLGSCNPHRDWILLANHFDRSLMRNHVAFYLGGLLEGLDFTPMSRFVHLYVNNVYMGVYQLTDERNLGPGRTEIHLDSDPTLSEFMLEMDGRVRYIPENEGLTWVRTNSGPLDIRFPSGDYHTLEHAAYVRAFINRVGSAISGGNFEEIARLIDIPSFVDFFLVQELIKNPDVGWSSVFMTLRGTGEGRRVFMGPLWDFDIAIGNYHDQAHGRWAMEGKYGYSPYGLTAATRNSWFRDLMHVPEFAEITANRWKEIRDSQIAQTLRNIEYLAVTYEMEFNRNFQRHDIMGIYLWQDPAHIIEIETFMGHVEFLLSWLERRIVWLDGYFSQFAN